MRSEQMSVPREGQSIKPRSWSFYEALFAVLFFALFWVFKFTKNSDLAAGAEALLTALGAWIFAHVLAEAAALREAVKEFDRKIAVLTTELTDTKGQLISFENLIISDERIIYARDEPHRKAGKIAIVGVEAYELNLNKKRLPPQSGADTWAYSLSILRFDRIQDLLFSRAYLEHFFALRKTTVMQERILIVNDVPRSAEAVHSFLQISRELKIGTFVYKKREFYRMLEDLHDLMSHAKKGELEALRCIFRGNPELNVMVEKPSQLKPWSRGRDVRLEEDYLLRYLNEQNEEVAMRRPGDHAEEKIDFLQVERLFKLMHHAIQDGRGEPEAFDAIYHRRELSENYWSAEKLALLGPDWH
jgi:hypothetical protein